jgi:hypothetical protein
MSNGPLMLFLAILFLEMLFQAKFARLYFLVGLPIFRHTVKYRLGANPIPDSDEIELSMPNSRFRDFRFKALDSSNLGFREQFFGGLFQMSYTPVMHGLLSFDRRRGIVSVTGYANWFTLAFIFFFIEGIAQDGALFFAFALALIIGIIYVIQASRFSSVAEVVVEQLLKRGASNG